MDVNNDHAGRSRRLHLVSTALALLIAFILLMAYQYVVGRRLMIEELETEAAIIAANSTAALVFNDAKAAQETIDTVRLTPRITGGALYRSDGSLLAWASVSESDFPLHLTQQQDTKGASTAYGALRGALREDIHIEGSKVGTLMLYVSFSSLNWRMFEYAFGVIGIATVALAMAYHLTASLRRRMAQAEGQLQQMALYDRVTGLPNRVLFERELRLTAARVARDGKGAALLFIDVDDFKKVNDAFGHAVGDQVLVMIGERMTAILRAGDIAARLGGDEFGVILNGIDDPDAAAKVAGTMIDAFRGPLPTEPTGSHVGLSIGIALLPDDGVDPGVLLRRTDMAMYEAKRLGKNRFHFFSDAIDARVRDHLQLEAGLRQALHNDGQGLWLAYQPQLCAQTRQLVGVEALLRWRCEDGRQITPGEFIPVAEQTGLIVPLGDWVLRQACRDLATMRASGVDLPKISINVSPRQLLRGSNIAERFCATLARFGEPASRFEIELTESALMEEGGSSVLDTLHAAGFSLSIDDFGTGYSSLGYLKRLQIGELKIDQRFVRGLPADAGNAAIVTAVVQMSGALNMKVVAEGVETEAQAEFLRACACDVLQGYLLGRPMPATELVAYVRERQPLSV